MITKEDIITYFKELSQNNCDECPFGKECDIIFYDSEKFLCKYMITYAD